MPNLQADYEQSVVKILQLSPDQGIPSAFLKSLVLHAMLQLGEPYKSRLMGEVLKYTSWQTTVYNDPTQQYLNLYSDDQRVALPRDFFERVFTHAEILGVLEGLWKSLATLPLGPEYVKLLGSSCDLASIAKTVQNFTSCCQFTSVLYNQGTPYLSSSAHLASYMDRIPAQLSTITQQLANAWIEVMVSHLSDPHKMGPKNQLFVLKLFEYSPQVVEFLSGDHVPDTKILHVLPWIHPHTMQMLLEGRGNLGRDSDRSSREQLTLKPTALDAAYWYCLMQASQIGVFGGLRALLIKQGARFDFIPSSIPSDAAIYTDYLTIECYRKSNIQELIVRAQKVSAQNLIWDYFSRINGSNVTVLQHVVTNYFVGAFDETSSQKKELLLLLVDKISRGLQPDCTFNEGPSHSFSKPRLQKNFKAYMTYASFAANALDEETSFIAQFNTHSPHPWHLPMTDATAKQKNNLRAMVASLADEIQFSLQEDPRVCAPEVSDRTASANTSLSASRKSSTPVAQATMPSVATREQQEQNLRWNNFMWVVLDAAEKLDKKMAEESLKLAEGDEAHSDDLVLPLIVKNNPWIVDVMFQYFTLQAARNTEFLPQFLRRLVVLFRLGDETIHRFFAAIRLVNISFLAQVALYAVSEPRDLDSQTSDMLQKFKEIFLSMPDNGWVTNAALRDIAALVSSGNLLEDCSQDRQLHFNSVQIHKIAPLRHQRLLLLLRLAEQMDIYQPPDVAAPYRSTNLYKIFIENAVILILFLKIMHSDVHGPQHSQAIINEVLRLLKNCHPDCVIAQLHAFDGLLPEPRFECALTIDILNMAANLPDKAQALCALQPHLEWVTYAVSTRAFLHCWLNGAYSDDEFRAILKILHKTSYLRKMLFEGQALDAILTACEFPAPWRWNTIQEKFNCNLLNLKKFCSMIDELDPKLLKQYLQEKIGHILTTYFLADSDSFLKDHWVKDKYKRGLQQLFLICLQVASAHSAEDPDASPNLIHAIIEVGTQNERLHTVNYFHLFWQQFLQSMVTDPRINQNIDHFHGGLHIRAALCSWLFKTQASAAEIKNVLDALVGEGLLLEFYIGENATQASPAHQLLQLQSDTLVMHQALQCHAWGGFFGLCDKLYRLAIEERRQSADAKADPRFYFPAWTSKRGVWQRGDGRGTVTLWSIQSSHSTIIYKDGAGFTAIDCALLAWPHFLTAILQAPISRTAAETPVSLGIDALSQYTQAVKQLIAVLQQDMLEEDPYQHFLGRLLGDGNATSALTLLLESSENLPHESIPQPLLNAIVKAFNELFVTFGLSIAKDQKDNRAMCQFPNQVFLKKPALAQRVDARLSSENPGPIFKQLLPFFEYVITRYHGAEVYESSHVFEDDVWTMQEHLPHYSLKLFTQALQAYASGVGTRHHRETVKLLLPVLQQALQEKTIPERLNKILSGVFISHSPKGHMRELLKKVGRLDVTLMPQDFTSCCEASKKYCFAEIIWHAFGAGNTRKIEVQRYIRRQFLTLTGNEDAENDKILLQAFRQEPELASQASFMNTLATIVKTYQPEVQRKFPYFSLALLQRDLMCFRSTQSGARDKQQDCAIAAKIIDAIERPLQMLLQSQEHVLEDIYLLKTTLIMGILKDNSHRLSSALLLILQRYPNFVAGNQSADDALTTGIVSVSEAQAEDAARQLVVAAVCTQEEVPAQGPVADVRGICLPEAEPCVVETKDKDKDKDKDEDEFVLVVSDDEGDESTASSVSEAEGTTAQHDTAKTLSQIFQDEKPKFEGDGLAVKPKPDWYKDTTEPASEYYNL